MTKRTPPRRLPGVILRPAPRGPAAAGPGARPRGRRGAARELFSTYGFRGATVDQIAALAKMTKPNLLYYFRRKPDIYLAVLRRTLEMWLQPLEALGPDGDPAAEITAYIHRKLEMSRDNPTASRLFAIEIMQGAPVLGEVLSGRLKKLVDEKAAVIRRWIGGGPLAPVGPSP